MLSPLVLPCLRSLNYSYRSPIVLAVTATQSDSTTTKRLAVDRKHFRGPATAYRNASQSLWWTDSGLTAGLSLSVESIHISQLGRGINKPPNLNCHHDVLLILSVANHPALTYLGAVRPFDPIDVVNGKILEASR